MIRHYSLLCLFGISTCFIAGAVGRVAIIGGERANHHHSFPYQVSLVARGKNDCGGGIIGNQFIITAAQCTIDANNEFFNEPITIVAGTNNLHHTHHPAVIGHVEKIYVPQEFNVRVVVSPADIAILKLKRPLDLKNHKNLKRLDLPPRNVRENYVHKTAVIAGFGWDNIKMQNGVENGGSSDYHLKYAPVDVLDQNDPQYYPHIDANVHLCARVKQHGNVKRGTCTGDAGSPLVFGNIAIGILNLSPNNCEEDVSGAIYTRVSHYLDFIDKAIADNTQGIRTHLLL